MLTRSLLSPAIALQSSLQNLYDLLASQVRVGCRATSDKGIIHNHRCDMPEISNVGSLRASRVPENIFQWIGGRAHIKVGPHKSGAIFIVILLTVTGDMFVPDDALAIDQITRECQAGYAITFGRDWLPLLVEAENEIMYALIIGQIDDRAASPDD